MRKKLFAIVMSMTMVASFMPSLAFAATGVVTNPATDADEIDGTHHYENVVDNADVQALLKDPDTKDYVVNFVPSTCDKDGSVTLKCDKVLLGVKCNETKTFVLKKAHEFGTDPVRFSTIEAYAKAMNAANAPGFEDDSRVAGQIAKLSKTYCYVEAKVCKNCGAIDAEHSAIGTVGRVHEPKPGNDCKPTTECIRCNKVMKKEGAPAEHSFGTVPTSEKKACKNDAGEVVIAKTYTCSVCKETKTTYTKKTNGTVTTPNCKVYKNPIEVVDDGTGKKYKKGSSALVDDNGTVQDGFVKSLGTYYESDTAVKDPESGKTFYAFTCSECGYVTVTNKEKTVDAVPEHTHAWKKVTKGATCVAAPMEAAYCEGCGMYSAVENAGTDNDVATGNMRDNFEAPVATAVANKFPLGHKLDVKKVEANCVTPAHYEISCSVCGDDYADDPTTVKYVRFHADENKPSKYLDPMDGTLDDAAAPGDIELTYLDPAVKKHAFTKKVVLQAANCETNELEGYKCDTCGKMDIHNVTPVAGTKLGHTVVKNEVAATCGADGYYTEECSACGKVLDKNDNWVKKTADTVLKKTVTDKALVATGAKHTGEVWKVTKKSTVFEEGVKTLVCDTCGVELGSKTPTAKAKYAAPAVKAGKKSATVTVKATADAAKYQIRYKKAGGSYKTIAANAGKKTIKKLAKGKKYTFQVIAINAEGVKVASATKTVKVK